MRCPQCNNNQRYSSGMICAKCRYKFVLVPKSAPFCADRRFNKAIAKAGDEGRRAYTAAQLHATIFRPRNRMPWRRLLPARGTSDIAATARALDAFKRAGRSVGLAVARPHLESANDQAWPEPDIYDYGAEGVLIVDDPLLVDLMVANGVHTTAKIAILEGDRGYPAPVLHRVRTLVAARPDLPVFLLHSSARSLAGAREERARALLGAAPNPVIDLGLDREMTRRIPPLRWARRMPVVPVDLLPHRWLTEGVVAVVARRVSLAGLLEKPGDQGPGDQGGDPIFWGELIDDFG